MKTRLQGIIMGIVIGVILSAGTVFAVYRTGLYVDIISGVKIVVDGREIVPKDANGATVEPFIYEGTTYLPVRAVADAFGKAVYWDGPEFTVYLGEMDGKLEYPTATFQDLDLIGGRYKATDDLVDNYGNSYKYAVKGGFVIGFGTVLDPEYLLNMRYSRFKATVYVPEGTTSNDSNRISIIADGKTIYTSPEVTKASRPIHIDVDITGCNEFSIETAEYGSDVEIVLGEAGFYQ